MCVNQQFVAGTGDTWRTGALTGAAAQRRGRFEQAEGGTLFLDEIGTVHEKLTQAFERVLIKRALAHTGGRRIEAAQILGIGRNTITRKIQELNIDGGRGADGENKEEHS